MFTWKHFHSSLDGWVTTSDVILQLARQEESCQPGYLLVEVGDVAAGVSEASKIGWVRNTTFEAWSSWVDLRSSMTAGKPLKTSPGTSCVILWSVSLLMVTTTKTLPFTWDLIADRLCGHRERVSGIASIVPDLCVCIIIACWINNSEVMEVKLTRVCFG